MASLQRKRLFALAKYIAKESSVSISVLLNNSCMDVVWMYVTYMLHMLHMNMQSQRQVRIAGFLVENVWFVSNFLKFFWGYYSAGQAGRPT